MNDEMPAGWAPRRRGRRPLVDIAPIMNKAINAPGQWVSFSTYSLNECNSIRRQLKKYGIDASIETNHEGNPVIYVMSDPTFTIG